MMSRKTRHDEAIESTSIRSHPMSLVAMPIPKNRPLERQAPHLPQVNRIHKTTTSTFKMHFGLLKLAPWSFSMPIGTLKRQNFGF
jgi:hypothetical protein